jgi:predicted PurR-regulated permease PerM
VRGNILFFFAVILGLLLAWRLRAVLELVYVSALFAVVLMPVVQRVMNLKIHRWSPSRTIAVVALVASVFLALAAFFAVAMPPVVHDLERFAHDLPQRLPELLAKLRRLPIANKLGVDSLAQRSENMASSVAQYVFASAPLWISRVLDLITAFVLCIYFMLEGEFAYYYFLSFFETEARERLARTLIVAENRMSQWLLGQGALMLILGMTSTAVFAMLHVRYFVLLGVLMGLFNIIPVAGGVITILLAGGVAALDSWSKMAGVFLFYAIYVQLENGYLTPRIMRTRVNLMGLSVIVSVLAGLSLAGVVGAMVAVPTAALVAVLMDEYVVQKDADAAEAVRKAQAESEALLAEAEAKSAAEARAAEAGS